MLRSVILLVFLCVFLAISEGVPSFTCGPTCQMYCEYGNVLDENGCPVCKCKEPPAKSDDPCGNGQKPLDNYSCAGDLNHENCPSSYKCVITATDNSGVCCPLKQPLTT